MWSDLRLELEVEEVEGQGCSPVVLKEKLGLEEVNLASPGLH